MQTDTFDVQTQKYVFNLLRLFFSERTLMYSVIRIKE
jgi:hypothetical protein